MAAKPSQLSIAAKKYAAKLREGRVLAIDPSSGSVESMPGYALFEAGKLIESGIIKLPRGGELYRRLRSLGQSLRDDFQFEIDVLIVENIPPFMSSTAGGFRTKSVVNLHKSIGAVLASVEAKAFMEVSPMSWHAMLKKYEVPSVKSDERDAVAIGCCALLAAGVIDGSKVVEYCYRATPK